MECAQFIAGSAGGPKVSVLAAASFAEFQRTVVADAALFAQLEAVNDPEDFAARAVQLGGERGFTFTAEEVRVALQAARRAWIERNLQ